MLWSGRLRIQECKVDPPSHNGKKWWCHCSSLTPGKEKKSVNYTETRFLKCCVVIVYIKTKMINATASIINYDKEGTLRWLCDYVSDCDKCCMFKVGEKTIALLVLP